MLSVMLVLRNAICACPSLFEGQQNEVSNMDFQQLVFNPANETKIGVMVQQCLETITARIRNVHLGSFIRSFLMHDNRGHELCSCFCGIMDQTDLGVAVITMRIVQLNADVLFSVFVDANGNQLMETVQISSLNQKLCPVY